MIASRKILLSVGAVGLAAGIAGLGTFATFTDTAADSHTIVSGTVNINLAASGADNRLSVGATGMVPGDSLQRRAKLTNAGNQDLASVTLTTTAGTSSLLDTDATAGLQMKLEKCGGALGWLESATTPYTYTCNTAVAGDNLGTRTTVLARRAVIGSAIALSSMSSLTAGTTDDLVLTVDLPSTTGNTFQGLTSILTYTFNATQRAAVSK
ncbi:MAG: TasA family protein [Acidimicrobiales bacterium]